MFGSVRPSICQFVRTLTTEPLDLRPSFLAQGLVLTLARLGLKVKVVGQGQMVIKHVLS